MRRLGTALVAVLLAATIGGAATQAAEEGDRPDSVLFIGNSLTSWNGGLDSHLAALAASDDRPRVIEAERVTAPEYSIVAGMPAFPELPAE